LAEVFEVYMSNEKRDAQATKARILLSARQLFASQGISAVSIRDIAKAAGVSHGMVQQYFGTRQKMIAEIIKNEIEEVELHFSPMPDAGVSEALESLRSNFKAGRSEFHDYALLIVRAELAGVKPETMLDPSISTPAMALADLIKRYQEDSPANSSKINPAVVSAYINAALFAFETIHPWLMASVGLKAEDYEAATDDIADITVKLISMAIGE
jgi:AcrR family transcriptional regulator